MFTAIKQLQDVFKFCRPGFKFTYHFWSFRDAPKIILSICYSGETIKGSTGNQEVNLMGPDRTNDFCAAEATELQYTVKYYVLTSYSKFNATFLNIHSICEGWEMCAYVFHKRITFALLPAPIACFWRWTFFFGIFYHYWMVRGQHCSCPLMHGEAFVCDCRQAFTAAQIMPIPRKEDTRIHPSSADILEHAAVFSQPSNCWHVFLKGRAGEARAGRLSTLSKRLCHRLMLNLLILLNKYRGIVLISKTDK